MFGSSNLFTFRSRDVFTVMGHYRVLEDEFSYPIDLNLWNIARVHNTIRREWAWLFREQEMFYDENFQRWLHKIWLLIYTFQRQTTRRGPFKTN